MSMKQIYKYIVAEDEPLIRKNVIKKINALSLPLELAGEAGNGAAAIALIDEHLPHLVITDIQMPELTGLEVVKYIYTNHPATKAVILSGYSEFSFAQEALKYGACDYILKPVKSETLKSSLQQILISIELKNNEIRSLNQEVNHLSQEEIYKIMVSFMKENYKSDVYLGSLAKSLGFTQEYLGKIFKKQSGQSPSKYLTHLRMNEAKQLLLQKDGIDIGKIGEYVGYKDAFYFSRAFKTHVGMSPSEYRVMQSNKRNRQSAPFVVNKQEEWIN